MSGIYLKYQNQKLKEVLLYILSKTGDIGYFRLMKTVFCTDRQNLLRWGDQVTNLDYFAWKHGPVPKVVCEGLRSISDGFESEFSDVLTVTGPFKIVHAMREPNLDYLSETDRESIELAINELKGMNRVAIESDLHEDVYRQVLDSKQKMYSHIDIIKSAGASKKQIERVIYEDQLESALT